MENNFSAKDALMQSQQLIDAMKQDFAFREEILLIQSILMRNQELISKIDAMKDQEDHLSSEDKTRKNAYTLELHSNMQGMSRLIKEMTSAGA